MVATSAFLSFFLSFFLPLLGFVKAEPIEKRVLVLTDPNDEYGDWTNPSLQELQERCDLFLSNYALKKTKLDQGVLNLSEDGTVPHKFKVDGELRSDPPYAGTRPRNGAIWFLSSSGDSKVAKGYHNRELDENYLFANAKGVACFFDVATDPSEEPKFNTKDQICQDCQEVPTGCFKRSVPEGWDKISYFFDRMTAFKERYLPKLIQLDLFANVMDVAVRKSCDLEMETEQFKGTMNKIDRAANGIKAIPKAGPFLHKLANRLIDGTKFYNKRLGDVAGQACDLRSPVGNFKNATGFSLYTLRQAIRIGEAVRMYADFRCRAANALCTVGEDLGCTAAIPIIDFVDNFLVILDIFENLEFPDLNFEVNNPFDNFIIPTLDFTVNLDLPDLGFLDVFQKALVDLENAICSIFPCDALIKVTSVFDPVMDFVTDFLEGLGLGSIREFIDDFIAQALGALGDLGSIFDNLLNIPNILDPILAALESLIEEMTELLKLPMDINLWFACELSAVDVSDKIFISSAAENTELSCPAGYRVNPLASTIGAVGAKLSQGIAASNAKEIYERVKNRKNEDYSPDDLKVPFVLSAVFECNDSFFQLCTGRQSCTITEDVVPDAPIFRGFTKLFDFSVILYTCDDESFVLGGMGLREYLAVCPNNGVDADPESDFDFNDVQSTAIAFAQPLRNSMSCDLGHPSEPCLQGRILLGGNTASAWQYPQALRDACLYKTSCSISSLTGGSDIDDYFNSQDDALPGDPEVEQCNHDYLFGESNCVTSDCRCDFNGNNNVPWNFSRRYNYRCYPALTTVPPVEVFTSLSGSTSEQNKFPTTWYPWLPQLPTLACPNGEIRVRQAGRQGFNLFDGFVSSFDLLMTYNPPNENYQYLTTYIRELCDGKESCKLGLSGAGSAFHIIAYDCHCPPGTEYHSTFASCMPCEFGFYSEDAKVGCKPCLSGMSSEDRTQCVSCGHGYEPAENTCKPCAVGFYKDFDGEEPCLMCPPGTQTTQEGMSTCTLADDGLYKAEGLFVALNVPSGTLSSADRTSTIPCPRGTFAPGSKSTSCSPCPVGSVATEPGSAWCDHCPLSHYTIDGITCIPCPEGAQRFKSSDPICLTPTPVDEWLQICVQTGSSLQDSPVELAIDLNFFGKKSKRRRAKKVKKNKKAKKNKKDKNGKNASLRAAPDELSCKFLGRERNYRDSCSLADIVDSLFLKPLDGGLVEIEEITLSMRVPGSHDFLQTISWNFDKMYASEDCRSQAALCAGQPAWILAEDKVLNTTYDAAPSLGLYVPGASQDTTCDAVLLTGDAPPVDDDGSLAALELCLSVDDSTLPGNVQAVAAVASSSEEDDLVVPLNFAVAASDQYYCTHTTLPDSFIKGVFKDKNRIATCGVDNFFEQLHLEVLTDGITVSGLEARIAKRGTGAILRSAVFNYTATTRLGACSGVWNEANMIFDLTADPLDCASVYVF